MDYTEIKRDCTFWIAGSGTATIDFAEADIVGSVNLYYNEITSLIMQADGR